ncbi:MULTISPECIES: hypothetical protein [unclassified Rhizobium]|nr:MULTISPECIES: hypothetical protein [unclassified Rhizobium]
MVEKMGKYKGKNDEAGQDPGASQIGLRKETDHANPIMRSFGAESSLSVL